MDPNITSIIIAVLALISSIGAVILGNRFTARTARQAQEATREIEEKKLDVSSWQEQVKAWREDVRQLRELRVQDQQRHEQEIGKCMSRIDALETARIQDARDRAVDRAHIDAFVAWGRIVVALLKKAKVAYPPAPPGLNDTDPGTGNLAPVT